MKIAAFLLIVFCADQTKLTRDEQRLADAMQRYADKLVKLLEDEIADDRARGRHDVARSLQARLKQVKDNPHQMPRLYLWSLKVGDIGRLAGGLSSTSDQTENRFQVLQVVDENNMLIQSHDKGVIINGAGMTVWRVRKTVWVSGVKTDGIVDDAWVAFPQVFEVKKTRRYGTALGGSSTVFELSPFPIQDATALTAELGPKPKPKPTAPAFRTWTNVTGNFTVHARFAGIIAGKLNLLTKDGRKIQLEPDKLSEKDQEYIRDRKWLKADQEQGDGRSRWINESYDTTIYHVKGKQWEVSDNKTGKVVWNLVETARTEDYVELFNAKRKEHQRLFAKRMEAKRGDKWRWLANGHWD